MSGLPARNLPPARKIPLGRLISTGAEKLACLQGQMRAIPAFAAQQEINIAQPNCQQLAQHRGKKSFACCALPQFRAAAAMTAPKSGA
jgi:hypothetical protein